MSESGYEWARQACEAHSARLASAADLWHAILECSFSVCTRGWMDGGTAGTTVCKSEGGGSLRTVDVKVEEDIEEEEKKRLDAFCVKDRGAPCGAPPTFPHTRMQSQTGLELGDELVFGCEAGFRFASGDSAFSLLCDSCGEWYGHVQLCMKDEAEPHVDYEDKFPNEGHTYLDVEGQANQGPETGEEEEHGEEHGNVKEEGQWEEQEEPEEAPTDGMEHDTDGVAGVEEVEHDRAEEEEGGEEEDANVSSVTDPPVSLLSQKHLFWFPSEAFHDDDDHVDTPASDHKHSGAKEPDSGEGEEEGDSGAEEMEVDGEVEVEATGHEHYGNGEHDNEHHAHHNVDDESPTEEVLQHTDKSWLDGYPIDEEVSKPTEHASEETEGTDTSEEIDPVITEGYEPGTESYDKDHQETHHQPDETHSTLLTNVSDVSIEEPFLHSTAESLNGDDVSEMATPSGAGADETITYATATTDIYGSLETTPEFVHHVTPPAESNDVTAVPEDVTSVPYHVTLSPDDVTSEEEEVDAGIPPVLPTILPDDITALATDVPILAQDFSGMGSDIHNLTKQSMPTEEPCEPDTCPSSSSSSLVAIVTVGTIVAVAGIILGVWLYRRRQRKSSHYQFNGTSSHTQNFEMQQTA